MRKCISLDCEHKVAFTETYLHPTKKMLPPINTFFSFDHISVISWVWVENLISLESWYSKLFHDAKIFFVFWRFFELWIFEQKSCIFFPYQKISFLQFVSKKYFFVKTCSCIDYFAKKFLEKMCALMSIWWSEYECDFQTCEFPWFC